MGGDSFLLKELGKSNSVETEGIYHDNRCLQKVSKRRGRLFIGLVLRR